MIFHRCKFIYLILVSTLLIFTPAVPVFAQLGVGVGTGKMVVEEQLKPGMTYRLPALTVINTGDQAAIYGVGISYHQDQLELKPEEDWFRFEPETFHLEPRESQRVEIDLTLPLEMVPGNYFAYVRGFPYRVTEEGETAVNIAAAAKLEFSVAPANLLQALYYRTLSFWQRYQPWTNIALGAVSFVVTVVLVKKFFSFNINIKKRSTTDEE